ncbi:MAG: hypothetical protein IT385_21905 [Deltaproteobacteria bacterium]|nr:hypothetical protein [Deltaproteobacteria bacterium]
MSRHLALSFIGLVALSGCASHTPCALRGTSVVMLEEGAPGDRGARRLVRWDVADEPVFWTSTLPTSQSLAAFRHEARRRVGDVSAGALLERAIAVGSEPRLSDREVALSRRILASRDRLVVPMRCFDALFLARQADRRDMIATPTEVLTFVLRAPERRMWVTNGFETLVLPTVELGAE